MSMSPTIKGLAASPGWVIGTVHILAAHALNVPHIRIHTDDIAYEQNRLKQAISATLQELAALRETLSGATHTELAAFIEVHELMLHDPILTDETHAYIANHQVNAAWALSEQVQTLAAHFSSFEDAYLRERAFDVQQVGERVLKHLDGAKVQAANDSATDAGRQGIVLVAHDVSPADFVQWQSAGLVGIVTAVGGLSSHTAIVSRAHNLPAVLAVENILARVNDGDVIAVNGSTGEVWVNPDAHSMLYLTAQYHQWLFDETARQSTVSLPAVSQCGTHIQVFGNIESPDDMPDFDRAHLDGVGLMRSEFLFMGRTELPDEQQQYEAYSAVVKALKGKPAVIRTLDVGADKLLSSQHAAHVKSSPNPALGLRAVRYSLANPELFLTQLRALLRAAQHGTLEVLLPMIVNVKELLTCKQYLAQAQQALADESIPFGEVRLGVMIEIPAAAIAIDTLLPHIDFCSVGTNDLIQYLLAVDRSDNEVAALYDPTHPALAYVLKYVFEMCHKAGKPVTVCGEMAGDSKLTHYLLNLGLRRFSLSPSQAASVKAAIRTWDSSSL